MELVKYFRWTGIICLLFTYLSFIGRFLHETGQEIYDYFLYGSASVFIMICTIGVIIYSKKFGIMSYVLALLSFIGWIVGNTYTTKAIDWIANDTYYSIQGETFMAMFVICLVASIVTGIVAFKKGEAGLAKFSGVILLLLQGILYVCMFVTWVLSGGGF